jgi:hypothetical protein
MSAGFRPAHPALIGSFRDFRTDNANKRFREAAFWKKSSEALY